MTPTMKCLRYFSAVAISLYLITFIAFALFGTVNVTFFGLLRVRMDEWFAPLVQFAIVYFAFLFSFYRDNRKTFAKIIRFSIGLVILGSIVRLYLVTLGMVGDVNDFGPQLLYQLLYRKSIYHTALFFFPSLLALFYMRSSALDPSKNLFLSSMLLVFVPASILYLSNGYTGFGGDTTWNVFLPHHVLSGGSFPFEQAFIDRRGHWALNDYGDGYLPVHPIGAAFFAFPTALLQYLWGGPITDLAISWNQKVTAVWVSALSAALLYQWSYLLCRNRSIVAIVTLVFVAGSPQTTISSITLWQHGSAVLLINIGLLLLIKGTIEKKPYLLALAGLPLAFLPVVRLHTVILYFGGLFSVFALDRKQALHFIFWSIPGVALVLSINLGLYHSIFGGYIHFVRHGSFNQSVLDGFLGLLFSANRGMFIFTPFLLISIAGFILAVRNKSIIAISFSLASFLYLFVHAKWSEWYAGWCIGARFTTEIVPVMILLAVIALQRFWNPFSRSVAVLLAVLSIVISLPGMFYPYENEQWNAFPDVNRNRERLWSFKEWLPYHFRKSARFAKFQETPFSSATLSGWGRYYGTSGDSGESYRVHVPLSRELFGDFYLPDVFLEPGDYVVSIQGEAAKANNAIAETAVDIRGVKMVNGNFTLPQNGLFEIKKRFTMEKEGYNKVSLRFSGSGEIILDSARLSRLNAEGDQ